MDEDDREFPPEEWEARIEAAYRRMKEGRPPVPWLPRLMNLPMLRRCVRRVRAGVIKPRTQLSTRAWIDTMELGIAMSEREVRAERLQAEDVRQMLLENNRTWMETYRTLEQMPEAADPTSEIGARLLAMKRRLRKVRGRRRRGRKR